MPDNFEKAKDAILTRTDGNGGPTPRDLLVAMGALAQDVDDSMTDLGTKFDKHCVQSADRLDSMEDWREHLCDEIRSEHQKVHGEHVDEMHKLGLVDEEGEEQGRKVWFMWLIGSKVSYVVLALLIFVLQLASNWLWHSMSGQP